MPIRTEESSRYPKNWPEIRERIRARAGDKCEGCGVPNHCDIIRTPTGWVYAADFIDDEKAFAQAVYIICTTAHLNHIPEDCRDENLRFWCQKYHNGYDAKHRAAGIRDLRDKANLTLDFKD